MLKNKEMITNLSFLNAGPDVCSEFEWKDNLTDSTVWNTGETGDIRIKVVKF